MPRHSTEGNIFMSSRANQESVPFGKARFRAALVVVALWTAAALGAQTMPDTNAFVRVSPRDPRYFELSNGQPYLPNGLNLVGSPPMEEMESVLDAMARNRVNYCRVWLNHGSSFFEHQKSGVFDEAVARNLDRFLALARERGIRVKLCLEYFRDIKPEKTIWHDNPLHHQANGGPFTGMSDFLESDRGLAQFKEKLAWYRKRVGDNPTVFAWELWNEMDCVKGDWLPWTRTMLAELHRLFPQNLAVQSLGSFDNESKRQRYQALTALPGNDVAQVHRYLDLGAKWDVCHGPMDVLAAEAVRELLSYQTGKPVILAETGGVEPSHSGAFKLYDKDPEGTLLHDAIWAPFMAGAAGTGQTWWWSKYVAPHNLWWQFARFAEAVEGIDPPAEASEPLMIEHPRLRVYVLHGKRTMLAWCRDKQNDWRSELRDGLAPETLTAEVVDFSSCLPGSATGTWRTYDPWTDRWQDSTADHGKLTLPTFRRSIVVRSERGNTR
jgi:hypothetical protein